MKITKITKLLPIALALALSFSGVQASTIDDGGDESTQAILNYQLKLNDYVKITSTTDETLTSAGTFDTDYKNLKLTDPMASGFKVISNAESRVLKLTATNTAATSPSAMYGFDKGNFYLVFTNNDATGGVAATSVTNITTGDGASAEPSLNPNAIAFKVTAVEKHVDGPTETPFVSAWVDDHIEYTMKNGVATVDFTIADKAEQKTFSTHDTLGTYKATLTLTDQSHI